MIKANANSVICLAAPPQEFGRETDFCKIALVESCRRLIARPDRSAKESAQLEHAPKKLLESFDQDMLQLIDIERFLFDHMIPCDREAHPRASGKILERRIHLTAYVAILSWHEKR